MSRKRARIAIVLLWIGIPIEANRNVDPPYVAVRLESEETINYILQQLPRA